MSLLFCIAPRLVSQYKLVRRVYPFITIFTAGVQLSTILVDLIPHMTGGGHSHDHSHGGDSHEHSHGSMGPFVLIGGIFIALLALDTMFLHGKGEKHDHTHDREQDHEHTHGDDNTHDHAHSHSHEHEHSLGTCNTAAISASASKLQAVLTLLAISVHSFFEGLAIGASESEGWTYLAGLLLHKILESFAISIAVFRSSLSLGVVYALILFYSLLTPLGIVFSALMTEDGAAIGIWFTALSLGSMMFIVFIEMIGHSFPTSKNQFSKLLCLSAGYTIGSAAIVVGHCHDK